MEETYTENPSCPGDRCCASRDRRGRARTGASPRHRPGPRVRPRRGRARGRRLRRVRALLWLRIRSPAMAMVPATTDPPTAGLTPITADRIIATATTDIGNRSTKKAWSTLRAFSCWCPSRAEWRALDSATRTLGVTRVFQRRDAIFFAFAPEPFLRRLEARDVLGDFLALGSCVVLVGHAHPLILVPCRLGGVIGA
jgi:hypothetical protein